MSPVFFQWWGVGEGGDLSNPPAAAAAAAVMCVCLAHCGKQNIL